VGVAAGAAGGFDLERDLDLARALGKLLAKLGPENTDSLRVSYHGALAKKDTGLVSRTALTAFLEVSRPDGHVNIVNAPAIAAQLGLDLVESTINAKTEFNELLVAELRKGDTRYRVAGTIIGRSPRIVEIDHLYVDCNIAGRFLFVENDDRPGIVGVVGTALGTAGVNIANMDLSRTSDRSRAVTLIEVDTEPPTDLLEKLRATPGIIRVLSFDL
jgi:hypothetical protein